MKLIYVTLWTLGLIGLAGLLAGPPEMPPPPEPAKASARRKPPPPPPPPPADLNWGRWNQWTPRRDCTGRCGGQFHTNPPITLGKSDWFTKRYQQ